MTAPVPRASCRACGRPLVAWIPAPPDPTAGDADPRLIATAGACFCPQLPTLPTRTRILLLQHPREGRVPIGTARMAHRALPSSRLRVGIDLDHDPEVRAVLADPAGAYVLFPGPDAIPLERIPREPPVTLIALDGTWWQARKLLRLNPAIAALPRVAFRPRAPSGYLIRREPAEHCVSTIEALAEALSVLEPDGGRFERLLDPFRAMVERQRWFESEVRSSRHRSGPRRARERGARALAARLLASWPRIVCIHGEANGWPRRHPERRDPETVHWVAQRPASGETFEAIVAPRRELGPGTPLHVGLPRDRLLAGGTLEAWHAAWRAFTRPDDVLVFWGSFYRDLAASDGLPLEIESIDLRTEASRVLRRRFGSIESSIETMGAAPAPVALPGRGGRRLAALVGALGALCARGEDRT